MVNQPDGFLTYLHKGEHPAFYYRRDEAVPGMRIRSLYMLKLDGTAPKNGGLCLCGTCGRQVNVLFPRTAYLVDRR